MPRRAEPHSDRRRRRWYANIGPPDEDGRARERFAPATIGEHAKAEAWAWMAAERARQKELIRLERIRRLRPSLLSP